MLWMCSGHGVCFTDPGDTKRPGDAAIAWFDRYVKGDTKTDVGHLFEFVDQNGASFTTDEYPPPASDPVTATGAGDLPLIPTGGAGPATVPADGKLGGLGSLVLPFPPARAENAVNVPVSVADAGTLLGAPKLTITYSGPAPTASNGPTR